MDDLGTNVEIIGIGRVILFFKIFTSSVMAVLESEAFTNIGAALVVEDELSPFFLYCGAKMGKASEEICSSEKNFASAKCDSSSLNGLVSPLTHFTSPLRMNLRH